MTEHTPLLKNAVNHAGIASCFASLSLSVPTSGFENESRVADGDESALRSMPLLMRDVMGGLSRKARVVTYSM